MARHAPSEISLILITETTAFAPKPFIPSSAIPKKYPTSMKAQPRIDLDVREASKASAALVKRQIEVIGERGHGSPILISDKYVAFLREIRLMVIRYTASGAKKR